MLNNLDEDSLLGKNRDYDYKLGAKLEKCQSNFLEFPFCNKGSKKSIFKDGSHPSLVLCQPVSRLSEKFGDTF